MPVTDGSLTQRLGQMITDIGGFFTTVGTKLDTAIVLLTDIRDVGRKLISVGPNEGFQGIQNILYQLYALVGTTGEATGYQLQLRNSICDVPYGQSPIPLQKALKYLTQAGDGTPLTRNIQTLQDSIFAIGGALPNHATIYDLKKLFDDLLLGELLTGRTNIYDVIVELQSFRADIGAQLPPDYVTLFDLIKQLRDGIGTTGATSTVAQLLNAISLCICELNDKTPGDPVIPPGGELIPNTHLCAPGATVLWKVLPADWRQLLNGTWIGVPATINSAATGWSIENKNIGLDQVGMLKADLTITDLVTTCSVTTDSTTVVIEELNFESWAEVEANPSNLFDVGLDADALNVYNGGCKALQIQATGGDPDHVYHLITCQVGGDNNAHPDLTIYFYLSEPQ